MIKFIMFLMILMSISLIMLLLNYIFSKKMLMNREKKTPFECGFSPISKKRQPFSIHFFLISLIFLIFDIELTVLIPLIPSFMMKKNLSMWVSSSILIILILIFGTILEWSENSFKWFK
uniref:NADH-ubiquinone oxidoreductase chain 3 n=1 Tax=Cleptes metallicorpus TaxID=2491147 RepID=A0A3S8V0F8_9HYME|nr:NADH dehydrogenase subunit 3 [Cleptes metallicorpus]